MPEDGTMPNDLLRRIARGFDEMGFEAHGVHVRVGSETAEHRWAPDAREEIHSVAKAFSAIAVGIARDESVVDPDDIVAHDYTLVDLLTMTSGVDFPWSASMFDDHEDVAREFLSRPSQGRIFQYANASTYTAMRHLADRVGDVVDWLRPRLFEPLGLGDVEWRRCPRGHVLAGEGLALTTEEMSRLGLLIRERGVYAGRRIVSPDWIERMHSDWIEREAAPGYDGYAVSGWRGPGDAWRLHGAYGQMVIFTGEAVVTVSANDHFRADEAAALVVAIARDYSSASHASA